tara:strand:- start:2118 stop:2252 length:135 start_codon:yes stop_codon:yes gene_type:complete
MDDMDDMGDGTEVWLLDKRDEAYKDYLENCVDDIPLNFDEWLES